MDNKMAIEIWSDIACPYCYIGKRKLEKALEQFPHRDNIDIVWHSYELDPNLPKEAEKTPYYIVYSKKFATREEETKKHFAELSKLAEEVGLSYNFDKLIAANTSDALRLVKLANKYGWATEAEEVLFKAYFTEGKDVSDRSTLVSLGAEIGLKADEIEEMLDSDEFLAEIKHGMEYSERDLHLEYIPFYLFNNKNIIQGSIAIEEYLRVLEKSYAEWENSGIGDGTGDIINGQSCSIDGICN